MPGADGSSFGRTTLSSRRSNKGSPQKSYRQFDESGQLREPSYSGLNWKPQNNRKDLGPMRKTWDGKKMHPAVEQRAVRDIKAEDPNMSQAQDAARRRAAEAIKVRKAQALNGKVPEEVPMGQVRSMFQGKLQSIMLQNRRQCRKLFRRWDTSNEGVIPAARFHELLCEFGVDVTRHQSDEFMAKFTEDKSRITFNELFFGLMGLPNDFFTMNLTNNDADMAPPSNVKRPMPKGTSFKTAEKVFKTRLRQQLFNVEASINNVFERPSNGTTFMDRAAFWTMLNARGLMITQSELDELMAHFDLNCDGRISYLELATELLRLPKPSGSKHITSWHQHRPTLSGRCQGYVKKMRELCERASAPPAALYAMFTRYDADGSGKIAYDELVEMVKDTGTNVEGRDMPSEFLEKYSRGEGEIPYLSFIIDVLGLQPDALRVPGAVKGPQRPSTAVMVEEVSDGIKRNLQSDPKAIKRVFNFFDRDDVGEMRWAEFHDGVKSMGLPITRPQMKTMFKEFDTDGSGCLDMQEFARDVLGIDMGLGGSSRQSSRRTPPPPLTPGHMSSQGGGNYTRRSQSQAGDYTRRSSHFGPGGPGGHLGGLTQRSRSSVGSRGSLGSGRLYDIRSSRTPKKHPVPGFNLTKMSIGA